MGHLTYLTDGDIASMRTIVEGALPGTAVISTRAFVSDGGGGGENTWTPSGTVSCRLDAMTGGAFGREAVIADRLSPDANWIVTLPAETSITTDCRVAIEGNDYEVLALRAPISWEVSRRVEVNLVA